MCNVTIAKSKLQNLKTRTQKDLYLLRYESIDFTPINEDTLYLVRSICNEKDITCPLYKWSGEVKFKQNMSNFYEILEILASEHSIVFNLKKPQ